MNPSSSLLSLMSFGPEGWGARFVDGLFVTMEVSLAAYAVSLLFGLLGASAKLSPFRVLRGIADLYTTLVRALPELLLLLLVFYSGADAVKFALSFLGDDFDDVEVDPFAAAVIALGFIGGAYMTEVMRGAIQSIPVGQIEAAKACGMSPLLRVRRIILPQMLRFALPGMSNLWLNATKDSSLISVLGSFQDILFMGYRAASTTKHYSFFYTMTALCFLVVTLVSMAGIRLLEARINRGYK
jgi:polar amino acid transport system permease protein